MSRLWQVYRSQLDGPNNELYSSSVEMFDVDGLYTENDEEFFILIFLHFFFMQILSKFWVKKENVHQAKKNKYFGCPNTPTLSSM